MSVGLTSVRNKNHRLKITDPCSEVLWRNFIGGGDKLRFKGGSRHVAYCQLDGAGRR